MIYPGYIQSPLSDTQKYDPTEHTVEHIPHPLGQVMGFNIAMNSSPYP